LQWTREALLKFNYPIILWLTNGMATALAQQSPDFWSWRAGVFEFQGSPTAIETDPGDLDAGLIVEYKDMAQKLEQQDPAAPLLLSFYDKIGDYERTQGNLKSALHYYQLSLRISQTHEFTEDIATYQEKSRSVQAQMGEVAKIQTITTTLESLPVVESAGPWYRIIRQQDNSLYFNNSEFSRYGSADVPILYAASDFHCAFIEIFGGSRVVDSLSDRKISVVTTDRPLLFVDFTGHGVSLISQSLTAFYGNDRAISKQLAKTISLHLANVDGIKYRSSYDLNRFIYLIFERAARHLQAEELGTLMDYRYELLEISMYYGLNIFGDYLSPLTE
jgi:RES domain